MGFAFDDTRRVLKNMNRVLIKCTLVLFMEK